MHYKALSALSIKLCIKFAFINCNSHRGDAVLQLQDGRRTVKVSSDTATLTVESERNCCYSVVQSQQATQSIHKAVQRPVQRAICEQLP